MRYALPLLVAMSASAYAWQEQMLPARRLLMVVECPNGEMATKAADVIHDTLRYPDKGLFLKGADAILYGYRAHQCTRASDELGIKVFGATLQHQREFRYEDVVTIRTVAAVVQVPGDVPGATVSKSLVAVEINDIKLAQFFKVMRRRMLPSTSL